MNRGRCASVLTRQGVRNLDVIPGKSRGVRLPPAPCESVGRMPLCSHPSSFTMRLDVNHDECTLCGKVFAW